MDEKGLVRRCRTGEPGARREMYETYAGRVLAVCRRYVRDTDRARDLVHDTFLKAWDALEGFRPRRDGSLGAWLGRIASHLAVDELRRQKRLMVLSGGQADEEAELDRQISPEEAPVDVERLRQVPVEELIDLIASLPEGYREVFNLFCLDGHSHREIAHLLGISEKTSQTQYLKARRRLAALIAAKYGKDEKD
ncbi:MAG: sigma-70 family RNA polymerase sigma factor [Bacteroidales bacterium]|nr:sigma-70 family RNA polymerase sigma factor [Bacteroidales bacterium]